MNKRCIAVKKLKIGIASVFMLFDFFLGSAQQQVSLQEAIKQALKNKAEAKKAVLQVKKAEYKIDEAKAGVFPKISVGGGISYNPIIQETIVNIMGQRNIFKMGQPWNSGISTSLHQPLFDQRVFIGLKAAKSTREFYILNSQLTNEQIIANVATAYYNVFVQEENLKTLEISYRNTEKVRNIIKSLVDNGLAKPVDLDRMNVQLTNIASNKQKMINGVELAKNSLKFYMGVPIDTPIELEEKSIEPKPELIAGQINLDNRLEVKVLRKQMDLLNFNKKATEAFLYPVVSLQANYGWYGMGTKFPWFNGINNGVNWSDAASIGLNVNIPIFTGGATKSKIQQAEIEIQDLNQDIENIRLSLNLDYKNAITNMENALINIQNMKDNVALAEKVQANTQSNYQYGLATLTDLLNTENSLTEARQNYTNALLHYKQAEIHLIKARGELNTLQYP